ncbi:MAG: hypothetical protein E6R14_01945 [Thermomicrobiales bacterium]|nr:MAG: hypothetical protein E6R14_01945 [Thermomicrobiales bacterium]
MSAAISLSRGRRCHEQAAARFRRKIPSLVGYSSGKEPRTLAQGVAMRREIRIRSDHVNPGTSRDAARLMADRFDAAGMLAQENAVLILQQHFDDRFVTANRQGRHGIDQSVLRIFRELAPAAAWSQLDQSWYRE